MTGMPGTTRAVRARVSRGLLAAIAGGHAPRQAFALVAWDLVAQGRAARWGSRREDALVAFHLPVRR